MGTKTGALAIVLSGSDISDLISGGAFRLLEGGNGDNARGVDASREAGIFRFFGTVNESSTASPGA